MICSKCNDVGVLSSALGKNFYYCRNCKMEISLESPPLDPDKQAEHDDILACFDALTDDEQDEIMRCFGELTEEDIKRVYDGFTLDVWTSTDGD